MFEWKQVFRKLRLNENSSLNSWQKAINDNIDFKFLALAHLASRDSDIHRLDVEGATALALQLGFQYHDFYRRPTDLQRKLRHWGVELLQLENGDYQYLRTIRRLSGRMYVRFARKVGQEIQRSSWTNMVQYEKVKNVLNDDLDRYFGDNDEDRQSREDVILFFCELSKRYLRYNKAFDVSDIQEFIPLTEPVSLEIIREMCINEDGTEKDIEQLDVLPFIALSQDGYPVFQLPQQCINHQRISSIFFKFFTTSDASNDPLASAKYDERSGWNITWRQGFENGVPVGDIQSIKRSIIYNDISSKTTEEVIPQICSTSIQGFLIIDVNKSPANEPVAVVREGRQLTEGGTYQIISLDGQPHSIEAFTGDTGSKLDQGNTVRFTVPVGCDMIVVDGNEYPVSSSIDTWIDKDSRCKFVKNPGGRYYVEKTSFFLKGDIMYHYECNGENTQINNEVVPNGALWKKNGWLVGSSGDQEIFRKAVTFIEDLFIEDLQEPLDYGKETTRTVEIGDDTQIDIAVGTKDTRVEFSHPEHPEIVFRVPIPRTGVYFSCGKELIPIKLEEFGQLDNVREIAEKDFENLKFTIQRENEGDRVHLIRGNAFFEVKDKSSLGKLRTYWDRNWDREPHDSDSDSDSDYFSVHITNNIWDHNYKFHIYKPLETKICEGTPESNTTTVRVERLREDLQISYYVSFYERERTKVLLALPAHRQDKEPMVLNAEKIKNSEDDFGRCIETVSVNGFYNEDIDWGHGLLCFVAYKRVSGFYERYEIVSSGFFMSPPAGKVGKIEDDEFGLRTAIADKDTERIKSIMTSNDESTQAFVSEYIRKATIVARKIGGEFFLNSFRNLLGKNDFLSIPKEESGYIFLADWFFKKYGWDDYCDFWDPLMVRYSHIIGQQKPVPRNIDDWVRIIAGITDGLNEIAPELKNSLRKLLKYLTKNQDINENLINHLSKCTCTYELNRSFSFSQLSETIRICEANNEELKYPDNCDANGRAIVDSISQAWRNNRDITHDRHIEEMWSRLRDCERDCEKETIFDFICKNGKNQQAHYLFHDGYSYEYKYIIPYTPKRTISGYWLFVGLVLLGNHLHEWRMNPNINSDSNLLKEWLFLLKKIDAELTTYPRFEAFSAPWNKVFEAFGYNGFVLSLRSLVDVFAWSRFLAN